MNSIGAGTKIAVVGSHECVLSSTTLIDDNLITGECIENSYSDTEILIYSTYNYDYVEYDYYIDIKQYWHIPLEIGKPYIFNKKKPIAVQRNKLHKHKLKLNEILYICVN